MRFWNHTHKLSQISEKIQERLIPAMGSCSTLAGELLRAASRIYYDHYNNGSCNNVTGAWNFLEDEGSRYINEHLQSSTTNDAFERAMAIVRPYTNCDAPYVDFKNAQLNDALDTIVEAVTHAVMAEAAIKQSHQATRYDLFDWQERNEYADEWDEEDEEYQYA